MLSFVEKKLLLGLLKKIVKRLLRRNGVNPAWVKEYEAFKAGPKGARVDIEGAVEEISVDGISAEMGLFFVKKNGAVPTPPAPPAE